MPKISIIIPIYNVENHLEECLDSVLSQSFKDLEVICVNDGSTDNSLDIIKQYTYCIPYFYSFDIEIIYYVPGQLNNIKNQRKK